MKQFKLEVVLVDEEDSPLGTMEKLEAHRQGLLHRAFSVMLYRYHPLTRKIEVLLQQRAFNKYHAGGLWANTCCSHPNLNEEVLDAVYRRLQEEIFISNLNIKSLISIKKIGNFIYRAELDRGLIEHEFDHVLIGEYQEDLPGFNSEEIAQMIWVNLDELIKKISKQPRKSRIYAPWLLEVCHQTRNYLISSP